MARISGLGKSNQLSQYNYKDANHRGGIGYYKLVQVDYNGDFEEFPAVSIHCEESAKFNWNAYPNPASTYFQVSINSGTLSDEAKIQMLDMTGKLVYEKAFILNSGQTEVSINTENLAKGGYILKVKGVGLEGLSPIKILLK
ncbi:MAG TPA: T9SS type A sorting domain-containing protein [Bacteroidia bacterium]